VGKQKNGTGGQEPGQGGRGDMTNRRQAQNTDRA
jgi:hypothetical protein